MRITILFLLASISSLNITLAKIRLPNILSNGMVLQQKSENTLWGWANSGETIKIIASWNPKDTLATVADGNGKWVVKIQTPIAGGPYNISFNGSNQITLSDIWLGEIWLCSGQSNMEFSYAANYNKEKSTDISDDFANCSKYKIHYFHIPKTTALYPQENCEGTWQSLDSNTLKNLSAAAYFFGKKLNENLNVPIGLITGSWGGTPAEAWTPDSVINSSNTLRNAAAKIEASHWWPTNPGLAYNAMIAPLTPFQIAGTIWYQGESNVKTADTYTELFTKMIGYWRKAWGKNFPFYFVQIAPFTYGKDVNAGFLREAQSQTLKLENTGMVVTADLAHDSTNIHPLYKHEVGYRLAYQALKNTYEKSGINLISPFLKTYTLKKNAIEVNFINADQGFIVKGKKIKDAKIAGEDGIFYEAEAKLHNGSILFYSEKVQSPKKLYYGFDNTQMGNICNKQGLPVEPFRIEL